MSSVLPVWLENCTELIESTSNPKTWKQETGATVWMSEKVQSHSHTGGKLDSLTAGLAAALGMKSFVTNKTVELLAFSAHTQGRFRATDALCK